MQPLATYVEKRGFAQRVYQLYDDKIEMKGRRTARGDFETEIPLKNLRLPKDVLHQTGDAARAKAMLPGLIVLIVILIFGEKLFSRSAILFWVALIASFAGMIFGAIRAKKFKAYCYNNQSGMPAFDISEHGNNTTIFETFSDLVDQQIKKSNTNC